MKLETLYPSGEIPCPGDIVMVKEQYRNFHFFSDCYLSSLYEESGYLNFTFTVCTIVEGEMIKDVNNKQMSIGIMTSDGSQVYMPSFCFDLIARGVLHVKVTNED